MKVEKGNEVNRPGVDEVKMYPVGIKTISQDLYIVFDDSGVIYDKDTLHCFVREGGKVRDALKDAMGLLKSKESADKVKAVFKYKDVEVKFTREDKYADVLALIQTIREFKRTLEKGKGATV